MRSIKSADVKAREEAKKNEVKEPPIITRAHQPRPKVVSTTPTKQKNKQVEIFATKKDILLTEEWDRFKDCKNDRALISNEARNKWKAGASKEDLAGYYARIKSKTEEASKIYSLILHIERFGELPRKEESITHIPNSDVLVMRERKRQLINIRNKLKTKLLPNAKRPKNSERITMWEQELALLNAEYDDLDKKLKKLNNDARA